MPCGRSFFSGFDPQRLNGSCKVSFLYIDEVSGHHLGLLAKAAVSRPLRGDSMGRGAMNLPYQVGNILLCQHPADVDLFLQRIGDSQLTTVKMVITSSLLYKI